KRNVVAAVSRAGNDRPYRIPELTSRSANCSCPEPLGTRFHAQAKKKVARTGDQCKTESSNASLKVNHVQHLPPCRIPCCSRPAEAAPGAEAVSCGGAKDAAYRQGFAQPVHLHRKTNVYAARFAAQAEENGSQRVRSVSRIP